MASPEDVPVFGAVLDQRLERLPRIPVVEDISDYRKRRGSWDVGVHPLKLPSQLCSHKQQQQDAQDQRQQRHRLPQPSGSPQDGLK